MTDQQVFISSGSSSASTSNDTENLQKLRLTRTSESEVSVIPKWQLWLHARWRTTCYLAYAEYYFEAWVTSTSDPGGARVAVDQLDMHWRHGETHGREVRNGVDMVGKDDRVYTYGIACDSDLCTYCVATHQGVSWAVAAPKGCIP